MKSFHYPSSVNSHHSLIECLLATWCWVPRWGVRGDEGWGNQSGWKKTQIRNVEARGRQIVSDESEGRVFLEMLSCRLEKRDSDFIVYSEKLLNVKSYWKQNKKANSKVGQKFELHDRGLKPLRKLDTEQRRKNAPIEMRWNDTVPFRRKGNSLQTGTDAKPHEQFKKRH